MKIELLTRKQWTGKALIALMFESGRQPLGMAGTEGGAAAALCAEQNFTGQYKKTASIRIDGLRVIASGLGKRKEFELDRVRVAVAKAVKLAGEQGLDSVGLVVPASREVRGDLAEFAAAAIHGAVLGSYRFDKYRTPKPDEPKPPSGLELVFADPKSLSATARKSCAQAEALCEAVCFTRDMGNEPSVAKPPEKLAELARALAASEPTAKGATDSDNPKSKTRNPKSREGRVTVKVMHRAELAKLGMNGILAVGAGSHNPPCMVHLTYTPKAKSRKTVCFVGKGITFDSGGISIKPAQGMEAMKDDMAGAAAVIGLFQYLGKIDLPVTVHGLVPLAENMPGGGAQRPGDVIRHYGGKTSEVISTDAEGRLILADALAYGSELKPDLMVDVATLTGACVVALGDEYSALLGTDQAAVNRLIALGRKQGEFFWQLPLPDRYRPHIKSNVADMKNTGKPMNAGTIIAGLFLKEFVAESVPWVHIDIAGPSFAKEGWDYAPAGATGVPLRTLVALIHAMA